MNRLTVPVFFSTDENYIPFLAVTVRSLIENASSDNNYELYILNTDLSEESKSRILAMQTENVSINFVDVKERLSLLGNGLNLRDYYTVSIYYRLFIPSMFPELQRAIYLDCDIVVLDDIAKLYDTEMGNMLLGVVPDQVVNSYSLFRDYVEDVVGVKWENYFNSGMLLMNLDALRKAQIEEKFLDIFNRYQFRTVAPDQDYLNHLCKDRVLYLDRSWNVMWSKEKYSGKLRIIHYNMFRKPWIYADVPFGDYFWQYADRTDYAEKIHAMRARFLFVQRIKDRVGLNGMFKICKSIAETDNTFRKVLGDGGKRDE